MGDKLRSVANFGRCSRRDRVTRVDRDSIPGRTVVDRRTLHIHDVAAEPEDDLAAPFARSIGVRTMLSTPLMREGVPIGTIHIRRMEVRPFTEKQVKLLETFADSSRHRNRERAAIPRTQGIIGTTNCYERNPGCYRQFTDRYPAGARCSRGERGAAV